MEAGAPQAALASSSASVKGKGKAVPTRSELEAAISNLDDALGLPVASTSAATRPAKKPRLIREPPTHSTDKLMSLLKPSTTLKRDLKPPPTISSASDPNSLPELLARIASLRPTFYSDTQPRGWDAATVARYGWQAGTSRGELTCATCGKRWRPNTLGASISGRGPATDAQVAERKGQLVSEHEAACAWRCTESLYRLPLTSKTAIFSELTTRLASFDTRAAALQRFRMKQPDGFTDSDVVYMRSLLNPAAPDFAPDLQIRLALALTGWTLGGSDKVPTLSCARCHRNVDISRYTSPDQPAFDCLIQHRPFCAFIENEAWLKQLPKRTTKDHAETYAWAWQGQGVKRKLSTKEVRQHVRDILEATPASVRNQ